MTNEQKSRFVREIVEALRCTSSPGAKCREGCRYRTVETIDTGEEIAQWTSCDCDRIDQDAADAIEMLVGG